MDFWGFENKEDAEFFFGKNSIDEAKKIKTKIRVCNPRKKCAGCFEGNNFIYSDNSSDTGTTHFRITTKINQHIICWHEEDDKASPILETDFYKKLKERAGKTAKWVWAKGKIWHKGLSWNKLKPRTKAERIFGVKPRRVEVKINYGIIAIKPRNNDTFADIVHFCGYENEPSQNDMEHFRYELEHSEEFGIGDEINNVIVINAPKGVVEYFAKKFEENIRWNIK